MKPIKSSKFGIGVSHPLAERMLLALSRDPQMPDYREGQANWTSESSLSLLTANYPGFLDLISGKTILDFGCGEGYQSVALAEAGASYVVGIDTNPDTLSKADGLLRISGLEQKVKFAATPPPELRGSFDVVISQNAMEHFPDPETVLQEMSSALRPEGKLLITFGPPWYAPYGAHMHFFTRVPWVNLFFSEQTVMSVRKYFRDDGAVKYEEVESGLNKMSVAKFERLLSSTRLRATYRRYNCVKGLNFLGQIPLARELFINHVSVILVREKA